MLSDSQGPFQSSKSMIFMSRQTQTPSSLHFYDPKRSISVNKLFLKSEVWEESIKHVVLLLSNLAELLSLWYDHKFPGGGAPSMFFLSCSPSL